MKALTCAQDYPNRPLPNQRVAIGIRHFERLLRWLLWSRRRYRALIGIICVMMFTITSDQRAVSSQSVGAYQFTGQGVVSSITGTVWTIGNLPVTVIGQTVIAGNPSAGSFVAVSGIVVSGNIWIATNISITTPAASSFRFTAPIEQKSANTWQVGGVSFVVLDSTQLFGSLETGASAQVTFIALPDGTLLALAIAAQEIAPTVPPATPTPTPAPPIIINCYQITFLGVVYHPNNTSSWSYHVMELPCAQDLSNWMVALPGCLRVASAAPTPWEYVSPDPNFNLYGVKWNVGNGFSQGIFSVTVDGHWTIGTVQVGVKGPDVGFGTTSGPSCIPYVATPTPRYSATPTMTPTVTPTLAMTNTSTATYPPPTLPPPTLPPPTLPPPTLPPPPPPTRPPSGGGSPITITENGQSLTLTCNGNDVTILGNDNNLTLLGQCGTVTVRGNNNRVSIERANAVINRGNNNVIVGP